MIYLRSIFFFAATLASTNASAETPVRWHCEILDGALWSECEPGWIPGFTMLKEVTVDLYNQTYSIDGRIIHADLSKERKNHVGLLIVLDNASLLTASLNLRSGLLVQTGNNVEHGDVNVIDISIFECEPVT